MCGKMLTEEEKQSRDPIALQKYLLDLSQADTDLRNEMQDAITKASEANLKVNLLKCKLDYIKRESSRIQSVLKSLSIL